MLQHGDECPLARVRYAKSPRDLEDAAKTRRDADEGHVRLLRCRYETDPEAIAAVVPRPLEAVTASEVEVLVAACSRGDAVHHVALIGARVDYDGTPGVMPIAMTCDLASEVIRCRLVATPAAAECQWQGAAPATQHRC